MKHLTSSLENETVVFSSRPSGILSFSAVDGNNKKISVGVNFTTKVNDKVIMYKVRLNNLQGDSSNVKIKIVEIPLDFFDYHN